MSGKDALSWFSPENRLAHLATILLLAMALITACTPDKNSSSCGDSICPSIPAVALALDFGGEEIPHIERNLDDLVASEPVDEYLLGHQTSNPALIDEALDELRDPANNVNAYNPQYLLQLTEAKVRALNPNQEPIDLIDLVEIKDALGEMQPNQIIVNPTFNKVTIIGTTTDSNYTAITLGTDTFGQLLQDPDFLTITFDGQENEDYYEVIKSVITGIMFQNNPHFSGYVVPSGGLETLSNSGSGLTIYEIADAVPTVDQILLVSPDRTSVSPLSLPTGTVVTDMTEITQLGGRWYVSTTLDLNDNDDLRDQWSSEHPTAITGYPPETNIYELLIPVEDLLIPPII